MSCENCECEDCSAANEALWAAEFERQLLNNEVLHGPWPYSRPLSISGIQDVIQASYIEPLRAELERPSPLLAFFRR